MPFYEQSVFGVWWDVRVDGVKDKDLSLDKDRCVAKSVGSNVSASTVRVLVPGSQATQKSLVSTSVSDFEVLSLDA